MPVCVYACVVVCVLGSRALDVFLFSTFEIIMTYDQRYLF
jgi:hypothetical protein